MSEEKDLLERFEILKKALFDCDTDTLEEIIAKDYVGYDPAGNPQDRKLAIEAYAPGAAQLERYDTEDVEVRIAGEIGIVSGRGFIAGTFAGEKWEHDLRFLDIYIMRDGAWRLYVSQVTPLA